jgi:hypothetical protein
MHGSPEMANWPEVNKDDRRTIYETIEINGGEMDRRTLIKVTSVERPLGEHAHTFPEAFVGMGSGQLYTRDQKTNELRIQALPKSGWSVVIPPEVAHTFVFDAPGAELLSFSNTEFKAGENTFPYKQLQGPEFERLQRSYFTRLGVRHQEAFKLHRDYGIWDKNPEGIKDWRNVSSHTLAEAARAETLAAMFGLSADLINDLGDAAIATDFYKRKEREHAEAGGFTWEAFGVAATESENITRGRFGHRIAWLAGSVGHTSLGETQQMLDAHITTEEDLAYLILHYVDDYTFGSDWAADHPGSALDARVDKNESNERYKVLDEDGREHLNGETTFQAQRRIGHDVEQLLVRILQSRTGISTTPDQLPYLIDNRIKQQIMQGDVVEGPAESVGEANRITPKRLNIKNILSNILHALQIK